MWWYNACSLPQYLIALPGSSISTDILLLMVPWQPFFSPSQKVPNLLGTWVSCLNVPLQFIVYIVVVNQTFPYMDISRMPVLHYLFPTANQSWVIPFNTRYL